MKSHRITTPGRRLRVDADWLDEPPGGPAHERHSDEQIVATARSAWYRDTVTRWSSNGNDEAE